MLNAWRRTILVIEEETEAYLPRLVPILLRAAAVDACMDSGLASGAADADDEEAQWVRDSQGRRRCVNPTLMEDKAAACDVLAEVCGEGCSGWRGSCDCRGCLARSEILAGGSLSSLALAIASLIHPIYAL